MPPAAPTPPSCAHTPRASCPAAAPTPSPPSPGEADLDTIRDAIVGRTIVVQRKGDTTEAIPVAKVTSLKAGTINFNDGDKARAVKATAIIATK